MPPAEPLPAPRLHLPTSAAAPPPADAQPAAADVPAGQVAALLQRQRQLLELAVGLLKDRQRVQPRAAIDAAAAAEMFDVGLRTWRTWDSAGSIPRPVKIAGSARTLWSTRELLAWLSAGCPPRAEWEQMRRERRQEKARRRR